MPLRLYECNKPTKPLADFFNTVNFGIPKGVELRNGNSIKGIVIHCVENAISFFDTMASRDYRLGDKSTPLVTSVHYAVGGNGTLRQYVCDENIAWGFAPQLTNDCADPVCTLEWSLVTTNPAKPPDEYILHIALDKPIKPRGTSNVIGNTGCGCDGATVLDDHAYQKLVHLLAWLTDTYNIQKTDDFIQFAQAIRKCPIECDTIPKVECDCADIKQLLCDVRDYCERCKSPRDLSFNEGNISTFYGENTSECKTKQSLFGSLSDRLRFQSGQLGIVDDEGVWHVIATLP